ncbi:MAG TPA: hypothetical protein DGG94_17190 [Micromonosporaceae bacterium]|nr:hypothetical protein [Micromonosporaceae bacterium]HCU51507.1 hypothetical protein [Micromonosporaceae bacterium]
MVIVTGLVTSTATDIGDQQASGQLGDRTSWATPAAAYADFRGLVRSANGSPGGRKPEGTRVFEQAVS